MLNQFRLYVIFYFLLYVNLVQFAMDLLSFEKLTKFQTGSTNKYS